MRNRMQEIPFGSIDFSDFSSFIFKVNHVFLEEKDNPPEKVVIDEEELDGLEKHCTWNLEDLNVVNNNKKRDNLRADKCPFCDSALLQKGCGIFGISYVSMVFLVIRFFWWTISR